MAEHQSALPEEFADLGTFRVADESITPKWRLWDDLWSVPLGKAEQRGGSLVLSISPGEWIVIGERPVAADAVDLTHVRAMIRVSAHGARDALEHLCALDLSDDMTPNGAAARTLVAGVATELVRDDLDGERSYLLLMSRSFARHTWDRLIEIG